jgi:hypothetical protein
MGCAAEIIALDDVRASQQRQALRQHLHARFDRWLDEVEAQLPEAKPTLAQVSETIWSLRQALTAGVAQTLIEQRYQDERDRQCLRCVTCARRLSARPSVSRTVRTRVGDLEIERPYFYCRSCRLGTSPLDVALGLSAGQIQPDVQQAAADLATEMPYETAAGMLERLSGIAVSSERIHTFTNQVAEGLSVLDVAPSRDAIDQRVAEVAAGRFRRPVLVLGIDGAYVPSRPENARGRRPGQARYRARRAMWRHAWYEAKGFRFYLLDDERIVHVLSWHQVQSEDDLGNALKKIKDEGLIPEDTVRLCVIGDGAEWIWKHVQALFPDATQVLDYYHCSEYLHKVAYAHYGQTLQALEWVEATLTRLYQGQVSAVLGGLRRMQPVSDEAAKAINNCWIHLNEHRDRTSYGTFRRGGYPLGSGGIESSNTCICHVRLKRSGAWWFENSSNQMLALRCAKYNGTFDQVFARYRQDKGGA